MGLFLFWLLCACVWGGGGGVWRGVWVMFVVLEAAKHGGGRVGDAHMWVTGVEQVKGRRGGYDWCWKPLYPGAGCACGQHSDVWLGTEAAKQWPQDEYLDPLPHMQA
jgi:hypothetical protein